MKALSVIATIAWLSAVVLHSGEARSAAVCGNGIIESPEACDDGNTTGGDSCSSTCTCVRGTACYTHPDASAAGSVAVGSASVAEGNSGTQSLGFPITRSGAAGKDFVLTVRSDTGSSASEATAGTDYVALPDTLLRLPGGTASVSQAVTIKGDTAIEPDEQFLMHITAARKAGAPDFVAPRAFDVTGGVEGVSTGDVNGDGKPDLLVGSGPGGASFAVLLNTGATTGYSYDFSQSVYSTPTTVYRAQFSDIDGDAKPDVVYIAYDGAVHVARNTTAGSTPSFATPVSFGTNGNPEQLAIAELTGDSLPDVAVVTDTGRLEVFRNASSAGTPSLVNAYSGTMTTPRGLALGDLDGDGKRDVAVANSTAQVTVFRNTTASGTFALATGVAFATGNSPVSVALGDIDGDSKLDIVAGNAGASTASVLRNTASSGTIASTSFAAKVDVAAAIAPYAVRLGDIDGDGKRDIAMSSFDGKVALVRNASSSGSITLQAAASFRVTLGALLTLELVDIDGDSRLDLVTGGNNQEALVLGNSAMSGLLDAYSLRAAYSSAAVCVPLVLADLDADGDSDLACRSNTSSLTVRRNDNTRAGATLGAATFSSPSTLVAGSGVIALAAGDLDGDGKPELVSGNEAAQSFSVLRNTSTASGLSFAAKVDTAVGAAVWGVGVADFNGDGKRDIVAVTSASKAVFYQNTSTGVGNIGFAAAGTFDAYGFLGVTVGDINADGKPDVIVPNSSNSVIVLRNIRATGEFSFSATSGASVSAESTGSAIGDLNGDGVADLVAVTPTDNRVHVFLNTGGAGGNFNYSSAASYSFAVRPSGVRVADVDADGRNDIVMIAAGGGVHMLRNSGITTTVDASSFTRHAFGGTAGVGSAYLPDDLGVGDLNADGYPDIVAGGETLALLTAIVPDAVTISTSEATGTILNDDLATPAVTAAPTSLGFGSVNVGSTSSASTFTVTNSGNVALSVTGVGKSGSNPGDFGVDASACGALAVGASCTVSVSFTPAAGGSRAASLTVATSESGVTAAVTVSGTGLQAAASLGAASLNLGSQKVGTASGAQTISLGNPGNATLTITSIGASGDFAQSNDCGLTLAAAASCTISVTVTPTATGSRTGTLTVVSSAPDSPATAALSATGTAPGLSAPASLDFAARVVGSTSAAGTIVVTNSGSAPLAVGTPAVTGADAGDFAITANDCGTVASGGTCSIQVAFTPGAAGARSATLSIPSDADGSPAAVALTGAGTDVPVEPDPETSTGGGGGGAAGPLLLGLLSLAALRRRRRPS